MKTKRILILSLMSFIGLSHTGATHTWRRYRGYHRHGHRGYGAALGTGLAIGALGAAAAASSRDRYYDNGYYSRRYTRDLERENRALRRENKKVKDRMEDLQDRLDRLERKLDQRREL